MLRRKKSSKSYYQRKFERELRKALKESKDEAENANQELKDNNDSNNSGDAQFVEKQFQQDENSDQNDKLHQIENSDLSKNDEENNQSQQYENSDQLQNDGENTQSQQYENDDIIQNDEEKDQFQQAENSDQYQQVENADQLQNDEENSQSQQNDDGYKFQQVESSDFTQKLENKEESQEDENSNNISESNSIKLATEVELNQNSISNKPDLIPPHTSLSLPLLTLEPQYEQKNDSPLKKNSFNNPLFVEFEIEAPNPNSSKVFINKKHSSPQLPILTNSSFSSTTSSATSSDDDTSHYHKKQKAKSIKTPTKNLQQNFQLNQQPNRFQQLKQQTESRQQYWQSPKLQEQNNDDEYFGVINDDDYSDYNDVEIDDEDDIINNNQFNTTIPQNNDKFVNQYSNSLNYSTKSNERQNIQYKQFPLQKPPPQRQGRISFSKINDPMLISAFSYLDEFDEKKKIEDEKNKKKSRKFELTHKGLPFYTFDSNKNNKRANLFPTDPIKPDPKMNPQMNLMIGLCNDLNQDGQSFGNFEFDNALDFRPGFEAEFKNNQQYKQKNDNEMAKNDQNTQKSYTFEIAPYLIKQNQKQQQTYTEPTIKNITETNDNDNQIHISQDEKESEMNENIRSNQANDKGGSRCYQQNDYFGTDDDYDIDFIDNLNSGISKNNETKMIDSEPQNKKCENPFYETIAKLGRPISKEIDIASFPTIPFRPMNAEDMYSLMMNSMIYNDKMFK